MTGLFWRMVVAAVLFVLLFLALPAFLTVIGVTMSPALSTLIRVAAAAIAIFYVLFGKTVPPIT